MFDPLLAQGGTCSEYVGKPVQTIAKPSELIPMFRDILPVTPQALQGLTLSDLEAGFVDSSRHFTCSRQAKVSAALEAATNFLPDNGPNAIRRSSIPCFEYL